MAILSFPTLGVPVPSNFHMQLVYNTQAFTSPLNKSGQTLELPGALWTANIVYEALSGDDSAKLEAFLMDLGGMAGRFYLWDLMRPTPRGVGGTGIITTATTAKQIAASGFAHSATLLKAGDKVGIGGELKTVTADVISDAGGNATISFAPPLRKPLATYIGGAVVTAAPTAVMRLQSDDQGGIPWTNGNFPVQAISCIEVLT